MLYHYISCRENCFRIRLMVTVHASIKDASDQAEEETILTYIDAQDWPPPTSDDLSSEQPVVEHTRACTQFASQARTLVCPCRLCTQYAALANEDAHYSWSHTASSGHICHRRHPKKTLTKGNY